MNLHALASAAVGVVNPPVSITILMSNGYTVGDDGEQIPLYFPSVDAMGQSQPLTFQDLKQLEGLGISGSQRALYINGRIDGLSRPDRKGGDTVTYNTGPDSGTTWLVTNVLEAWPDWTKVALTRQKNVTP